MLHELSPEGLKDAEKHEISVCNNLKISLRDHLEKAEFSHRNKSEFGTTVRARVDELGASVRWLEANRLKKVLALGADIDGN
nr:hypothetical protein [uncultured Desulfobulbus sp.]